MAKTLDKSKKRRLVKSKSKKLEKKQKISEQEQQPESSTPYSSSSSSSDDSSDSEPEKQAFEYDPEELRDLLRPYSKDQLVDLVCSAAKIGSSIYSAVVEAADRDVTHRKIFVYGLPWETTREAFVELFEGYGEIEECTVVIDKVTGKAKGFGFVVFKTRKGAKEALKEPRKRILNRTATCQLASMGPAASGKGHDQAAPVKISLGSMGSHGQPQQPQGQHMFNGGGMAASPYMLGNQYNPYIGTGMLGNPALSAVGGGYMYPMLAGAMGHGGMGSDMLLQSSQMGGIGEPGVGVAGVSVPGNYFRGQQSLPNNNAYPDTDTGKRGAGKDADAGGSSFQGYSNYSCYACT
ncbi:PREDICTED: UBP1-associated proteins 1A-like isoform X2 [Camelina sativa]|uniref:UBP1-associated proteins 1A-like isoform X2 n=1 Tax=Camelina sativa TaxID=90675 RepID=A0ABM0TNZ5_CAMSA|nr:PREDICTED: UBP1-associated proteins 1A-like isoform X2 [Camelina sativa]